MSAPPPPPPTVTPPPGTAPPRSRGKGRWFLVAVAVLVAVVLVIGLVVGIRWFTNAEAALQRSLAAMTAGERQSYVIDIVDESGQSTLAVIRDGDDYIGRHQPAADETALVALVRPEADDDLLAQYADVDGYIASLGGNPDEADLAEVERSWFDPGSGHDFLRWMRFTDTINFDLEGPWLNDAWELVATEEERSFGDDTATGYRLGFDVRQIERNLRDLTDAERDQFVGHFVFRLGGDSYDDVAETYLEGREWFNEREVTFWMKRTRLVAITAPGYYDEAHEEFTVRFTDEVDLPDPADVEIGEGDVVSNSEYESRIRRAIFGLDAPEE